MQPIRVRCPHCGHVMEYWTENDTIYCPACGRGIPVEPCIEKLDTEMDEEEVVESEAGV